VAQAEVIVKWQSGETSKGYTNPSGMVDLNCSGGTIEYIAVWGERVLGSTRVENNALVEVVTSKG
jgi:hypothetical protein